MQHSSSRIGTRRASLALAIGAALLGVLVIFGWILGISEVKAPLPGFPAMMANTAIALILTGGAVALAGRDTLAPWPARALALGVLAIAGASLFEDVSGIALGIDQFL
ncbi:MAG: hypothetical protein K2Q10_14465, partial [Rhodospirillales bacterium]|nr:hypothetical protein [Rhodospirillales bacterium]